jgi:putative ABC transport system ATP-binding protein
VSGARADREVAPLVALSDVAKTYRLGARRIEALRGVSLRIDEPGFYGIMGPSGSGKSTLLHLLAALDRPDAGTIDIAGCKLSAMSDSELTVFRRRRVGIVFQQFNLVPTLTALENATLPAMLDGMGRADRERRAYELLEQLGIRDRATHRPDALSGGEQQRVAIARALMFEPPVLFADEPTGNLDSKSSAQIWSLMAELARERSTTVLMVTHEPEGASYCRHVFLLRDGLISNDFDVDELDAAELATRAQQPGR